MKFDRVAILDWSAAGRPVTGANSIWLGVMDAGGLRSENHPTRAGAMAALHALCRDAVQAGERLLIGADFAFAAPAGFATQITGRADALTLWDWLAAQVTDGPNNATNYRDVAAMLNAAFPGDGPFWGNMAKADTPGLPRLKPPLPNGLPPHRQTDLTCQRDGATPKPIWQLAGAGAVGAQSLTGIAALAQLRTALPGDVSVWPFEAPETPVVLAEVYPSLLNAEVKVMQKMQDMTPDEAQVRLLATALFSLSEQGSIAPLFAPDATPDVLRVEGWILGAGHRAALRTALPATQTPPRLRNDCFAMPQGVDWVPVDDALTRLRGTLTPVTAQDTVGVADALNRVLAQDVTAARSNPPRPNSAVDGYGFAHAATGNGVQRLPLVAGRAAAGQPFAGAVPPGMAVRILTGAILPDGVDTVVLEEDCATDGVSVTFDGPVKPHANCRKAGEDMAQGDLALPAGHRLRAPDLALLAALGVGRVAVYRPLRVGVLSTGDEIIPTPGTAAQPHQIYDANRPMLLALAQGWGYDPVDLGHVRDDPGLITERLDQAADRADVVFTSGGASAGDEDHVSHLLRQHGTLSSWRIAMKPGRPLALALWRGVPVIGLPGNPVAAMVCATIFGRPALSVLSGAGWVEPLTMQVPAAFSKSKKAGRREYLRARLTPDGRAEVFPSEGSGRISGLSWATGLVELSDDAQTITPGTLVRFLPYAGLGV